jgi:hypothetical protein
MSPSDSMSPFLHVSMSTYLHTSPCFHFYLHVPMFISLCLRNSTNRKRDWRRTTASVRLLQTENRNGKLPFVCWKWKRKKQKFVFHGWRTKIGNRRLLFQQTCLSMVRAYSVLKLTRVEVMKIRQEDLML